MMPMLWKGLRGQGLCMDFSWNCDSQLVATGVLGSQVLADVTLYLVNPLHSVRKIPLMRLSPFAWCGGSPSEQGVTCAQPFMVKVPISNFW